MTLTAPVALKSLNKPKNYLQVVQAAVTLTLAGVAAYVAWFQVVRGLSRAQAELSGSAR